jgi:hypothetical protein
MLFVAIVALFVLAGERISPSGPAAGVALTSGSLITPDMVMDIWLPGEWATLAVSASAASILSSHDALQAFLREQAQERFCYVLICNSMMDNGQTTRRVFVRQPYQQPEYFEEFSDVLAAAAGRTIRTELLDYTTARIAPIPDEFKALDSSQLMAILTARGIDDLESRR